MDPVAALERVVRVCRAEGVLRARIRDGAAEIDLVLGPVPFEPGDPPVEGPERTRAPDDLEALAREMERREAEWSP